jgi:hypothetical protein
MQTKSFNLPDYADRETVTIMDGTIYFLAIEDDSDAENPTNDDGFGQFWSHSTRHINFKHPDETTEILNSDPDAVPLSYYEHGLCCWNVAGEANYPDAQWDSVQFAGIWVPDDCVRESYMGQDGLTRREWMVKQAESACEVYTQWVNGDCYGYSIAAYKVRLDDDGEPYDLEDDYRRASPTFEDSCWGYYGIESAEGALKDALESI